MTVQSSSTYVRKGNSLLRKPSSGSSGEMSLRFPPAALVPHLKTKADFVRDGLESTETPSYASDRQPKLESSNPSKILYVKRKANQLVAASDIHGATNSRIPPSGGYFKKSKNQLVRNPESPHGHAKSLSHDALDSRPAAKMVSEGSSSSTLSEFAIVRPFDLSRGPLVWTLSRKAHRVHVSFKKIVSQPVPWKRVTYGRRRFMNSASLLLNGSFPSTSRKWLMMRKRHTVYRRSTGGYSLRNSKLESIRGSHFKWSKSVERGSKKSDVESSSSGPPECGKATNIPSTLKRLMIGNDESVWIKDGNQLIRDPKIRTRVLANEKIRWSLHNFRLRLAKRMKYCQFFTRFGKCRKDDGRCPYIHDPSKIAGCTKFLSGSCANPDCKLTHKVLPETMPDCYYFLQGLCNNETCPYRHVHVRQSAAICEGFLRGYCSDKNECRKKHTYTCPVFEATGSCPQGSQCKLHHPKNLSKEKKRKGASEPWQKNGRGRYFGSQHKHLPESEPVLVNEVAADGANFGGEAPDFIRLDVNEHEGRKSMDSSTTESASDDSEAQDSIDELIRPAGLMQKLLLVTPSAKAGFLV